jgi:DNA polymerase-3 subunit alpha
MNPGKTSHLSIRRNTPDGSIRFGLAAIKGVGDCAAQSIIEDREANGPFKSFRDFASRIDSKMANKRVIECLIKTGGFDSLGEKRSFLLDRVEGIMADVAASQRDRQSGQSSLFDMLGDDAGSTADEWLEPDGLSHVQDDYDELDDNTRLSYEKELIGFYLTGHPCDQFGKLHKTLQSIKLSELAKLEDKSSFRLFGVLSNVAVKQSKRDNRKWALFQLSTPEETFSLNIYADAYEKYAHLIRNNTVVALHGQVLNRNDDVRLSVQEVLGAQEVLETQIETAFLIFDNHTEIDSDLVAIRRELDVSFGDCKLELGFALNDNTVLRAEIAGSLRFRPTPAMLNGWSKNEAIKEIRFAVKPVPVIETQRRFFTANSGS